MRKGKKAGGIFITIILKCLHQIFLQHPAVFVLNHSRENSEKRRENGVGGQKTKNSPLIKSLRKEAKKVFKRRRRRSLKNDIPGALSRASVAARVMPRPSLRDIWLASDCKRRRLWREEKGDVHILQKIL